MRLLRASTDTDKAQLDCRINWNAIKSKRFNNKQAKLRAQNTHSPGWSDGSTVYVTVGQIYDHTRRCTVLLCLTYLQKRPTRYQIHWYIYVGRQARVCGTVCHRIYDKTWTSRVSSINWKHFCLGIRQPRRIMTVAIVRHRNTLTYFTYSLTYWRYDIRGVWSNEVVNRFRINNTSHQNPSNEMSFRPRLMIKKHWNIISWYWIFYAWSM